MARHSAHGVRRYVDEATGEGVPHHGCRRVRLAPKPAPFDYAVAYPTPLGDVEVTKRGDGINVVKPRNMELKGASA